MAILLYYTVSMVTVRSYRKRNSVSQSQRACRGGVGGQWLFWGKPSRALLWGGKEGGKRGDIGGVRSRCWHEGLTWEVCWWKSSSYSVAISIFEAKTPKGTVWQGHSDILPNCGWKLTLTPRRSPQIWRWCPLSCSVKGAVTLRNSRWRLLLLVAVNEA